MDYPTDNHLPEDPIDAKEKEDEETRRKVGEYLLANLDTEVSRTIPTFGGSDITPQPVRECLKTFVELTIRYARLERLFQGDVIFTLPAHTRIIEDNLTGDPLTDGRLLAEEERRTLELGSAPLDDFEEILDEKGIKIFPVASPFTAAGVLFGEETGPAILLTHPPHSFEGRMALAHAYGHFIADINPYKNRFCLLGSKLQESPEEERAESFARHFLMPLEAIPLDIDPEGEEVDAFAHAYEVPAGVARLQGLQHADPEALWQFPRREILPEDPNWKPSMPMRYLNFVLAAYHRKLLQPEGMQVLLKASLEQVEELLRWVRQEQKGR
ncbi:MAG: ImmA/IrrE family metallo-endopeptidase [Candidatus Eisenbacteria bacterium]|uniref:ImmA/IrrE family metallo-endopeptidase n=1 Tax=Eiseniibacteriota bacterium TaxID=2212470 RepID=A0A948WBX2_UNCEI|nr:ImmA/IrrE family metallo-endopeptidase [Candidatus Eisenbacteria bacterium]MBU1949750.1 ImmA/IrrE family metallo-endopeptidase [Candidatus Eisenbacteria bacterium]MBU2690383.1 ImmA/IrrE family metallo-endopeptidase [Candidatus Eisenbacteria bacterium]